MLPVQYKQTTLLPQSLTCYRHAAVFNVRVCLELIKLLDHACPPGQSISPFDRLEKSVSKSRSQKEQDNMADGPMNMFAGIKKKKKKQVNIAELDVEGEGDGGDSSSAAPPVPATEQVEQDPVRPLEKDADLTLKDDEPLDFSDLKKKKKKKAVAIDLEDVATPDEDPNNVAAAATAAGVDKLGNTQEAEPAAE